MTVTASACSAENREQLRAVQERPSAVDAAIVASCVEPHRTVEADEISDDLKELVGWWRRTDVHPRQPRRLKRLCRFSPYGETVQQELVYRRFQQLRQVTGHWIKLSDKQTVDKAAGGPV